MTSMARRNRAGFDPVPEVNIHLEAWHDDGACNGTSGDWVSPANRHTNRYRAKQLELAVCAQCPVQAECLAFALETKETNGIWGGMFPDERKRLVLDQRTTVRLG